MPAIKPIPKTPALTLAFVEDLEQQCSCMLPDDYREFLLSNNGGFPTPDCVTFEEAGRKTASDVFCFFALNDERPCFSMNWNLKTYSDRLPENTLPIGRDSSGNLWLMSLRKDDFGSVYFWDHGSFNTFDETDLKNWPKVASSFQEFLGGLRSYDSSFEAGDVPSRYSLVKQATDGMARRDSSFSTRENPGFVWHCVYDDGGSVKMEFVKYEAHAALTHTCGYTRLRAIMGLIDEGPTRLPQ